jgi:hypothetical protein
MQQPTARHKVGATQVGSAQIGAAGMGAARIGTAQVGAAQVGVIQVGGFVWVAAAVTRDRGALTHDDLSTP